MVRRVVGLVLLLVVVAIGWVGVRGYLAKGHLDDAAQRLPTYEQQMGDLDVDGARATLAEVRADTGAARDLTGDPVWRVVGAFPFGGQNLRAVGTATATVDDVVGEGLEGATDAAQGIKDTRDSLAAGELESDGLRQAADGVDRLDTSLTDARERLDGIDRSYLVPQVEGAVTELRSSLDVARQVGARLNQEVAGG